MRRYSFEGNLYRFYFFSHSSNINCLILIPFWKVITVMKNCTSQFFSLFFISFTSSCKNLRYSREKLSLIHRKNWGSSLSRKIKNEILIRIEFISPHLWISMQYSIFVMLTQIPNTSNMFTTQIQPSSWTSRFFLLSFITPNKRVTNPSLSILTPTREFYDLFLYTLENLSKKKISVAYHWNSAI